MDRIF